MNNHIDNLANRMRSPATLNDACIAEDIGREVEQNARLAIIEARNGKLRAARHYLDFASRVITARLKLDAPVERPFEDIDHGAIASEGCQ